MLTARPDVIASRAARRKKGGYGDDWTVEQLDAIVNNETPRIGTWIDNSDLTPEETLDMILGT